ncbi:MAG TPA: MMPL family transporter [Bdellovibrionota bacterium]|nr:MMPL family transporter [Bdellovibrionota bacterium]
MNAHSLARSFHRHPVLWLFFLGLTLMPTGLLCTRLSLQSDFKRLLPQNKPSVVELDRFVEHVGGIGNLIVAIESEDYRATERFIDDLVVRLKTLPKEYVRNVEYNTKDVRNFYTNNKYLYLDLEDLRGIHDRLARKIRYEKLAHNPFYIALEEDKAEFDLSDIEEKYKGKTSKYDNYTDGYFFGERNRLAAVLIRPYGASTGTDFAKILVAKVRTIVEDLNPRSYHPSLKVSFTGKYQQTLDEYSQLIRDVLETLALCLGLVALALYLYFLRFRVIWLLASALIVGATWTFALTQLQIGYLNTQTAFLGSIIVGNGVNTGIILLARYLEERRQSDNIEHALAVAIRTTWSGTLTAAMTTSAAFAALGLSEIKGFSQFGFIGGIGMTLCWIATYVVVPPLLVLSERALPLVREGRMVSKQWETILYPVSALVSYSPKIVASFGILLLAASAYFMRRFLPDSLEYDFSKLRNRPTVSQGQKSIKSRVNDIFGETLSPAVILLDNEKHAPDACMTIMGREATYPESEKYIESCRTIYSFLPDRQTEKLRTLEKIRGLLADHSLKFLKDEYRKELEEFRKAVNLRKLEVADVPASIRQNFEELNGRLGRIVYVYSREEVNLNNGKLLMAFSDRLSDVRLSDGSVVHMSGEGRIFADLLRAIVHDGPIATFFSFLAVVLIVVLNFRRSRPIIYVIGGLVVGMIYMLGLQSLLEIKLNFFNFIALPVTFGIGVDYGVNLLQRYRFEGRGSIRRVLGAVGGAILLCSITTTVGYATLLTAKNQALASFGWLAMLGELACLFAAIVIMPAILHSLDKHHSFPLTVIPGEKQVAG